MANSRKMGWALALLAGLWMTLPLSVSAQADPAVQGPVSGRPLSVEGIVPADVLARIGLLRDELERVRFEMGQPKDRSREIPVSNVSPREVIFQALTLFRKANQLNFELTGDPGPELRVALPPDIRPFHVWQVVDGAYRRLLALRRRLGITEPLEERPQAASTTPTEAFRAIVQANRQFDLLLLQRPSTRDVFHQVTLATYYAARLLEQFPETEEMPAAPPFERGKRPADVYHRLLQCYTGISAITARSGIEALELEVPEAEGDENPAHTNPSRVYDLVVLIVSELAYLHAQLDNSEPPAASYDPGLKLPAHVYQRAGILLRQLAALEARVEANPTWLDD